jgi:ribosomal protein S18 acetylase RimI-like enzyme
MQIIKKITPKETYFVRNSVLRKGKPIESCYFKGDDLETTIHFGLYDDENCVAIVSVFQNKNDNFDEDLQFQIRGMAVLETYQNKGFGRQLIQHCEAYLKQEKTLLLWLNARESAVSFYSKIGYSVTGIPFEIAEIGVHYCMIKKTEVVAHE